MIASLSGTILEKRGSSLVLDVHGIGYEVYVTGSVLAAASVGAAMTVKTAHIIREDAQELYGFPNEYGLQFFQDLVRVSGVGPKTAMSILELGSVADLVRAIKSNDAGLLMRAGGVGRKTAERIIIELREKASPIRYGLSAVESLPSGDVDATDALVELGFPRVRAREALREVSTDIKDPSDRVKAALKILGKK